MGEDVDGERKEGGCWESRSVTKAGMGMQVEERPKLLTPQQEIYCAETTDVRF